MNTALLIFTIVCLASLGEAKVKSTFPWWLYAAQKASTPPPPPFGGPPAPFDTFPSPYGVPSSGMFLRGARQAPPPQPPPPPPMMPPMPPGYAPYYAMNPFFAWKMQKIYMEQVLNITTTPKPPKLKIKIKGPLPPGLANLPLGSYEVDNS